jgi:hypothetical protein
MTKTLKFLSEVNQYLSRQRQKGVFPPLCRRYETHPAIQFAMPLDSKKVAGKREREHLLVQYDVPCPFLGFGCTMERQSDCLRRIRGHGVHLEQVSNLRVTSQG